MSRLTKKINHIIFTPGHGGGDPGAVSNSGRKEADNVIKICEYIQEYYNQNPIQNVKISVEDPENKLGLSQIIQNLNRKFWQSFSNDRADNYALIEVHQDMNAPHLDDERERKQIGKYYYQNDALSREFADEFIDNAIKYGAYSGTPQRDDFNGSWRKGHYLSWRGFHLGFIQNTKAVSFILECGYVSINHTDEELKELAYIVYASLYKMFDGVDITINNIEKIMKEQLLQAIEDGTKNDLQLKNELMTRYNLGRFDEIFAILFQISEQKTECNTQVANLQQAVSKLQDENRKLIQEKQMLHNNAQLESRSIVTSEPQTESKVEKVSHVKMNGIDSIQNNINEVAQNTFNSIPELKQEFSKMKENKYNIRTVLFFALFVFSRIFSGNDDLLQYVEFARDIFDVFLPLLEGASFSGLLVSLVGEIQTFIKNRRKK